MDQNIQEFSIRQAKIGSCLKLWLLGLEFDLVNKGFSSFHEVMSSICSSIKRLNWLV